MRIISRNNITGFAYALIVYLSTISGFPNYLSYIIIVFLGYLEFVKRSSRQDLNRSDQFFLVFILTSVILFFIGKLINNPDLTLPIDKERSFDYLPFTILLLGTVFFAKKENLDTLTWLTRFILLEAIIAIFEFILGIPYIIPPIGDVEVDFGTSDLLYYKRVYGLSPTVSVLSQKILCGIVLVFYLKKFPWRKYCIAILLIALIMSFGRTSMLATAVFICLYYLINQRNMKLKYKVLLVTLTLCIIYYVSINIDSIFSQLFRGRDELDISGRDNIFATYLEYIERNWMFGNFFEKIYFFISGRSYHAHNSYLQMIATMGIPSFVLFILYLFKIINKAKIIYLLPFFIFSLSQYGLFWGCSLFDIIFYILIFDKNKHDTQIV